MYQDHEHFMYLLERAFCSKNTEVISEHDLQIGNKLYDLVEKGENYYVWVSQDASDVLWIECVIEEAFKLQGYCIKRKVSSFWEEIDFEESIYHRKLDQEIIGYKKALELIYDYDIMDLVTLACESFEPGSCNGFAVLDLITGEIKGISLKENQELSEQYLTLIMISNSEFQYNFDILLEDKEIEHYHESGKSAIVWLNENELDWKSRLLDHWYFTFQDKEEYEWWEKEIRNELDRWYSDYYSHYKIEVK
jgi:hypothetical protein